MRKLLNTLYVNQEDAYLHLSGGNVAVSVDHADIGKVPLINIEGIVTFGRAGASPALMNECLTRNIAITFMSAEGKFQGRVTGNVNGNVLLRKQQYRDSEDGRVALFVAKDFITGKLYNQRWMIERFLREHKNDVNSELKSLSVNLKSTIEAARNADSMDTLRGIEGRAAEEYFAEFNRLIITNNDDFYFAVRSRRPPMDRVNALLSLGYALLANDCAAALSMVGLDPYVGMMHQDRPGRISLALDLMEEMRGVMVDRFVIKLINKRIIHTRDFSVRENGAVMLTEEGRKTFLSQWQLNKQDTLVHPFLQEKIPWGLVPYTQAILLARYIRKDVDEYPPFMWK